MTLPARMVAALLALIAWIGIAIQFVVSLHLVGSFGATLAALLWYFTITTNLLVAVVFTGIALGRSAFSNPFLVGGTTLFITLGGVVYGLLLHGLLELSGGSAVSSIILHLVTPVLTPLFWLIFVSKGQLKWRDPLLWTVYPLGYLFYVLVRGEFSHRYPYPFIDVNELGWGRTILNAFFIAVAFLGVSWLFLWLDSLLGRRSPPSSSVLSQTTKQH